MKSNPGQGQLPRIIVLLVTFLALFPALTDVEEKAHDTGPNDKATRKTAVKVSLVLGLGKKSTVEIRIALCFRNKCTIIVTLSPFLQTSNASLRKNAQVLSLSRLIIKYHVLWFKLDTVLKIDHDIAGITGFCSSDNLVLRGSSVSAYCLRHWQI